MLPLEFPDSYSSLDGQIVFLSDSRLAPVLKTIFHQFVIYTCSQSNWDSSVLRTGTTGIIAFKLDWL